MNSSTVELVKTAARTLLAHRDAGRTCDPHSVAWAEQLLRQNPDPAPTAPFDDDIPKEKSHATRTF